MKATKKIVCLTLAIVLAALAFIMPVSAAGSTPLVIVDGFNSTKLYQNFGTKDEKEAFLGNESDLETLIVEAGGAFLAGCVNYGLAEKNFEALAGCITPVINKYLEPLGYNTDGTPKDTTIGFYRSTEAIADYTAEQKADLTSFATETAKGYGEENTYNFAYDWRADPTEVADELNEYIGQIKEKTNSKKVNVVALSLGSSIVLAYLAEYGGRNINNLVFASPAWQGTSLVGDLFNGNVELDIYAVENFLVKSADVSATTHITAYIISFIASYEGLSHEYFGDINAALQGLLPYIYRDTIIPLFAGIPGLWALVPAADYDTAKTYLFPEGIDANLEAITDAYHDIQVDAKTIIDDAMAEGMRFGIVGGYNRQMAPINEKYEQSDEVIDVKNMTGGATCALYLQAYDDWGQVYKQAKNDGHNHVSWDYKVDLSTAMYPEQTWLLKNMSHTNYVLDYGTLDTVLWLLNAEEQYTVHTDKENHPQFSLYNTYKRKVTPITIEGVLGDLDDSGAVNTLDARIALKIAAGQIVPTEEQLFLGDIDEDGEISTVDARCILCIAAGVPYKI